jgi:hypothetical protein
MANQLPTEIWYSVFQNLCRSELRSTLRVSTLLHDISICFLFSNIRIYFTDCHGEALEFSREILDYISGRPYFAKVVKEIEVHDCGAWSDYGKVPTGVPTVETKTEKDAWMPFGSCLTSFLSSG